jgi:hypothetical protein
MALLFLYIVRMNMPLIQSGSHKTSFSWVVFVNT